MAAADKPAPRPAYAAPRPTYAAPTYAAPTYKPKPTYAAPTYAAPTYAAPTYKAQPSYHPAPSHGYKPIAILEQEDVHPGDGTYSSHFSTENGIYRSVKTHSTSSNKTKIIYIL